jgi:L-ascorbate metabolism protein UlaG (beta-lactamase superfamily)
MKITFYGHSMFSIQIENKYLLVDPFFTKNPNFKGKENLFLEYFKKKKIDFILITHAHYDHILDVELLSNYNKTKIISNYEICFYFKKKGILTYELNYGSFVDFNFFKIKYVWACHSSVFEDGTYGGNPGGFIIKNNKKSIYLAGDTSLTQEMKLIPYFSKIDLAILPIGGRFTMNTFEAKIASDFIQCNKIMGIHYDTFKDIKIDHKLSKNFFLKKGKELILLNSFEYIYI